MRRTLLILTVLMLTVTGSLIGGTAHAAPWGTIHLPDLVMGQPTQLRVLISGGERRLHMSTTVFNVGQGALDLRPVNNTTTGLTKAKQRFFTHDDAGVWKRVKKSSIVAGNFVFHPTHNHTHFEDFALYAIHSVTPEGGIGAQLRTSQKVSFCIIDTARWDGVLDHTRAQTYGSDRCTQTGVQGLSVGWGDTYTWQTPGQYINITGLPTASYWLVVTADPVNRLREIDDTNNTTSIPVNL